MDKSYDRPGPTEMRSTVRAYTDDKTIHVELESTAGIMMNRMRELQRWEINTVDEAIRQKLISLGWTPPASLTASDSGQ